MNIGLVGGLDRAQRGLSDLAATYGHHLETHTGNLVGPSSTDRLRLLVNRCDLVLVLTDINSHNAVRLTRKLAQQSKRPISLLRRLGRAQFVALLEALSGSDAGEASATSAA